MNRCLILTAILFAPVASARANPAHSPEALEVLKKARQAASQIKSVSYSATVMGEGALAKQRAIIDGQVFAKRGENGEHLIRLEGTNTFPRTSKISPFRFATDGKLAFTISDTSKSYYFGDVKRAETPEVDALFTSKLLDGSAFDREFKGAAMTYEGTQTVEGVECDVVKVDYDSVGLESKTFFFGREDHLLRRTETPMTVRTQRLGGSPKGILLFSIYDLKPNTDLDNLKFQLDCPPGYARMQYGPKRPKLSRYLPVGSAAPDWTLPDSAGKTRTLKDLRGKVVVLDFWATWCGPCKRAMPEFQKLHEQFEGRPVAVFGVNCRERNARANPAGYAKQRGFTYPQLLKGDRVASEYRVRGIPTYYVIGKDGKVLYAGSGYSPRTAEVLAQVIKRALQG